MLKNILKIFQKNTKQDILNKNIHTFTRELKNTSIKALVIADRSPYEPIKNILEKNNDIELIITLWDLEYLDISYLKNITNIPKIGIYWNHCDWHYLEHLWIKNLHLETFDIKWIKFWWFEWCVRYKKNEYAKMYTQEEATELFKDFESVDILVSHNAPFWIQDAKDPSHIWFKIFNEYIKKKHPKYLLHGHTDPEEKNTKYIDTEVIFLYWSEIINLEF